MSQADMEKAYAEAVDALARAVEANQLLTERIEMYEMQLAEIRRTVCRDFPMMAQRSPYMDVVERVRSLLDPNAPPLHDEQPSG